MAKVISIFLSLLISISVWADNNQVNKKSIYGDSGLEIYMALAEKIGVEVQREGESPESGCYKITSAWLLGMRCQSAWCYDEESHSIDLEQYAACHFEHVKSQSDLKKIRRILKTVDLNSKNPIFKD